MSRMTMVLAMVFLFLAPATLVVAEEGSADDVMAYLDGKPITIEEVDELLAGELLKLRQQEYDLRRRAVDRIVAERLFEKEAAARGITVDELFEAEVASKTPDPSDEEVAQFYEQNKDRYQQLRGKTLDEVAPMIRAQIRQQGGLARQNEFLAQLRAAAKISYKIDPPRVTVAVPEGEPAIGPEDAAVTVVEFSDFQCGYCRRVHPTILALLEEYGDKIRFVYRDYALNFHPRAEPSARAARCAGDQGKYWEYHNNLFQKPGTLDDADLKQRAADLELDQASFAACFESDRHAAAVQAGFEDGAAVGVSGTPTFFVNGRSLVGAVPLEQLKQVIDEELALAAGSSDEG